MIIKQNQGEQPKQLQSPENSVDKVLQIQEIMVALDVYQKLQAESRLRKAEYEDGVEKHNKMKENRSKLEPKLYAARTKSMAAEKELQLAQEAKDLAEKELQRAQEAKDLAEKELQRAQEAKQLASEEWQAFIREWHDLGDALRKPVARKRRCEESEMATAAKRQEINEFIRTNPDSALLIYQAGKAKGN